ncbi:hypothetical protein [Sedimenticola hydrogenitrophicus]|uniref:hypothetical protein n=1 Tax=Sedimenticola hydrogenitrophicus TaxID=2967975 RepID=UPI0021A3BCA9|nr:hypothetical protein [Sedimenticola hydrogenitrophicus]
MIEVSKLLLLVMGELLLLSVIYAVSVNYFALAKRRRDRAAIRNLIARIKEDSGRRESETRKLLEQRLGLSGDNLEETVRKIARGEKAFYQALIDVYLRRDTEAVQNLCVDYEGSVDAYRTIEIPKRAEPAGGDEEPEDHTEELILLKAENQRLADELQLTMDTMGNMLSEYTQMFAGGVDASLDRDKMQEIVAPTEDADPVQAAVVADEQLLDELLQQASADEGEAADNEDIPDDGDELKALDEALGILELSVEDPAAEEPANTNDLDETMVLSPEPDVAASGAEEAEETVIDQDDEVINLDDVLDDPDTRNS